jgi:hypothetical protein
LAHAAGPSASITCLEDEREAFAHRYADAMPGASDPDRDHPVLPSLTGAARSKRLNMRLQAGGALAVEGDPPAHMAAADGGLHRIGGAGGGAGGGAAGTESRRRSLSTSRCMAT